MVYCKKSQPAPPCLAIEKQKKDGDYKCGDVLQRIQKDFYNKCYLCECAAPISINVEHFDAHGGDLDKKFEWLNLFYACAHCNNTKLARYNDILNCTIEVDEVETAIRYEMRPYPKEQPRITPLRHDERTQRTAHLLNRIFNGETELKKIESANLREALLQELCKFQKALLKYEELRNNPRRQERQMEKIEQHLHKSSAFTAFKRWVIRDNPNLFADFGYLLD